MRSRTLVVLALIPLAGCDWGFVSPFGNYDNGDDWWGDTGGYYGYEEYLRGGEGMTQVSSLGTVANGLAFSESGNVNVASMGYQTCRIQTSTGMWDVEDPEGTPDDNVQDGDGGTTLNVATITSSGVRISRYTDDGLATTQTNISIPGAHSARFDGDGIVYGAQNNGCRVGWTGSDSFVRVGTLCGGFDATPSGTAFVVADGTVHVVTPSGDVTDLDAAAQLVAWDPVNDQLFTAIAGDNIVSAIQTDGTVNWTTTVAGPITSLTDMGSRGAALVGLTVDGLGRLSVLDGANGNEIAYGEASEAPLAVWASPDGSTFGAQTSWNTHFIHMDE